MARLEIDEALGGPQLDIPVAQTTPQRKERFAWALALVLVAALGVAIAVWALRPLPPAGELRFEINTPTTTHPVSLAISPDGRKIVFVATSEGRSKLWLRRLDSAAAAEPLPGTDGAMAPFWSPDSRTVGFFTSTDNQLKHIDVDSGSLQTLGTFPLGTGGTWNRDGTILFSTLGSGPIFRISSKGGEASAATRPETPTLVHQFPQFLPDGRHFLYHTPNRNPPAVYIGQLDGSETRRLMDVDAAPVYVPSGYLLFLRQRTLFAQAFDPVRLALSGTAFRVAEQVMSSISVPAVSVSGTGTVVYRTGSADLSLQARPLVWFDRSGKEIGRVGDPNPGFRPSLSPDGRQVALARGVNIEPPNIWLLTLGRDLLTTFTSSATLNLDPVWSPDGSQIAFSSLSPRGVVDLYRKPTNGVGVEELLLATAQGKVASAPSDWSDDGFLLYVTTDQKTSGDDIWALPLHGDRQPFPVVETSSDEQDAQFSPDGRWIAYQSNETGRHEIYAQPFPRGPKEPISTNGGAQVRWRRNGRELFYIALDGRLMAVPIRIAPDGKTLDSDPPVPLFATSVGGAVQGRDRQQYVVSADGQRFLMSVLPELSPSPITVILNFKPNPTTN
jgi:Tol biopolymer transport system component